MQGRSSEGQSTSLRRAHPSESQPALGGRDAEPGAGLPSAPTSPLADSVLLLPSLSIPAKDGLASSAHAHGAAVNKGSAPKGSQGLQVAARPWS